MHFLGALLLVHATAHLLLFLAGLYIGLVFVDEWLPAVTLTCVGLAGMSLFSLCWIFKPHLFSKEKKKKLKKKGMFSSTSTVAHDGNRINPDTTETLMKNIRGIPYLIQAIQYSMETSYYRDLMSEMGEGIVRTSVIHTAPACTSVLDSDSEEEVTSLNRTEMTISRATPRHSAEEQWLPFGDSTWRNEQLRLSLNRPSSNSNINTSPQGENFDPLEFPEEHDFSRIDSIRRPHLQRGSSTGSSSNYQIRCIGMSASFIEKFNSSFRKTGSREEEER